MIYGIGVDMVRLERMERVLNRWGPRFLDRVFTPKEIDFCRRRVKPASCLAMRFAAKEAFSKALGTGMRQGVHWRHIEVFHDPHGKPGLNLYGETLERVRKAGIKHRHLSLSDEGEYAVAMVVLEC